MKTDRCMVYVVDDDPSVLKALQRLLSAMGYETMAFRSAIDFLNFHHPHVPSCLILDVKMPELSGLELQERLAATEVGFPIIFITGHATVPISVQAMKAGAVDFLQKPFLDKDLLEVVAGAIASDRQAKQEQAEVRELQERLKRLTPRENEVFRLVITGMLNKQVAYDLGTSEKTIKVHRARIMEKLEADSLADLVHFAHKLGISS